MKRNRRSLVLFALATGLAAPGPAPAQETNEVEQLRRQVRELHQQLEKSRRDQLDKIEQLEKRLETLSAPRPGPSTNQAPSTREPLGASAPAPPLAPPAWRPQDPIRLGRGSAYLDIGLVANVAAGSSTERDVEGELELGGHDPNQRGFTLQGVEATFTGAVDPYLRGFATVSLAIDSEGETSVELEEGYGETISLPWNLQLRGGQYLTEFGRHNPTHLHSWSFVDAPLVNGRYLGPDGLRNPGARLSWLMPLPFYSELFVSVQNSQGETATSFRSEGDSHHHEDESGVPFAYREADNDRGVRATEDMLFAPRYAVSFDLTDAQVLLLGASAAFGPNASGDENAGGTDTQIYGLDVTWKWKSPRHVGGFPFVAWQTEALWRRYDAGSFDWDLDGDGVLGPGEVSDPGGAPAVLRGERLEDYGFYSQVLYGFRKGWVAGLRWDYVTSDEAHYENRGLVWDGQTLGRDPDRLTRWRWSPNLTYYPTEFSKVRLQYNYDERKGEGEDHSVWLQFEFVLGAHAAHKF